MPMVQRRRHAQHPPHPTPRTPRQQALIFWSVVLVLCLFGGVGSFAAGKYWLGRKLRDIELRTPKNAFPTQASTDTTASTDASNPDVVTPPDKPIVHVEARQPTDLERDEADNGSDKTSHKSKSDNTDKEKPKARTRTHSAKADVTGDQGSSDTSTTDESSRPASKHTGKSSKKSKTKAKSEVAPSPVE